MATRTKSARARVDARFVNSAMMATLMGAVVSDGLENGQVVSGVGGQYNFVAQAFALQGARSILTLEATRQAGAKAQSNIRWSYGHETIPRHLRDIIVTEYGVADLRGKSDADVIAAMLAVADSRFQAELARQAKDAGKLPKNFEIPAAHRENFPERIARALKPAREAGLLPSFPFGSDFTDDRAAADSGLAVSQGRRRIARRTARAGLARHDEQGPFARGPCMSGSARAGAAENPVRQDLACACPRRAGARRRGVTRRARAKPLGTSKSMILVPFGFRSSCTESAASDSRTSETGY